jgi:hypothetical protein
MMQKRRLILPAIMVLAAVSMAAVAVSARVKPLTAYQTQLRAQVDTAAGAPLNGRDPAAQSQTSLAAAASAPVGNGLRTDAPAAAVAGDHSHHVHPADVLPDPRATGKTSGGCLAIPGDKPGEKCVTNFSRLGIDLGYPALSAP